VHVNRLRMSRRSRVVAAVVGVVGATILARPPTVSAQSPWVMDWLREYAAGGHAAVAQRLASVGSLKLLQDDLDKLAPAWLAAPGVSPDRQRRAIAAFALEAALGRLDQRDAAAKLLEWGCRQVRRNPKPDEFDRRWHLAAIALFEGALAPDALEAHLVHARFQFPNEPRFALVRGVAEEQRTLPAVSGKASAAEIAKHNEEAARRYDAAAAVPSLSAEANLRLGHVQLELGHPDRALEHLDQVEPKTEDGDLVYLTRLFRGLALDRLGRADDARAAYGAALTLLPGAQSAMVALAALLVRQGQHEPAEQLVTDMLTREPSPYDPWWRYWPGDYRMVDGLIAAMREAMK
jgi:tetratricopeptide (TPR) repeat protein